VSAAADLFGSTAAVWATALDGPCWFHLAAVALLRDRDELMGVALAGAWKPFGSRAGRLCRSGLLELTVVGALAGARCPPGRRQFGFDAAALVDRLGDVAVECQPATGGVAASAAAPTAQLAARTRTMRRLRSGEEIRRENIGRSLGEAFGNWLVERFSD
jgi:hypothetical protein